MNLLIKLQRGFAQLGPGQLGKQLARLKFKEVQYFHALTRVEQLKTGRPQQVFIKTYREGVDRRNFFLQRQQLAESWSEGMKSMVEFQMGLFRKRDREVKQAKEEKKEKSIFDVEIVAINAAQKIKIIKAVREILGLGLKEAKDAVEKLPSKVKQAVGVEEANKLRKALEEAGCKVELK